MREESKEVTERKEEGQKRMAGEDRTKEADRSERHEPCEGTGKVIERSGTSGRVGLSEVRMMESDKHHEVNLGRMRVEMGKEERSAQDDWKKAERKAESEVAKEKKTEGSDPDQNLEQELEEQIDPEEDPLVPPQSGPDANWGEMMRNLPYGQWKCFRQSSTVQR
jgi:hypothetical protein